MKEKLEILQEKIHFASEIQKKIMNDTSTSNDETRYRVLMNEIRELRKELGL
jgi:hypothetical protein